MQENFHSFENLVALQEEIREVLRDCYHRKVCPECGNDVTDGVGTGNIGSGLFCDIECFARFRAKMIEIYLPPERN